MKNAQYDSMAVRSTCDAKAGTEFRKAKELNAWVERDGLPIGRVTVPRGRKFLPPKTYASMARQLKLSVPQFDEFMDCTMSRDEYFEIALARRGEPGPFK